MIHVVSEPVSQQQVAVHRPRFPVFVQSSWSEYLRGRVMAPGGHDAGSLSAAMLVKLLTRPFSSHHCQTNDNEHVISDYIREEVKNNAPLISSHANEVAARSRDRQTFEGMNWGRDTERRLTVFLTVWVSHTVLSLMCCLAAESSARTDLMSAHRSSEASWLHQPDPVNCQSADTPSSPPSSGCFSTE